MVRVADEGLMFGEGCGQRGQLLLRGQPLHRFEPMDDGQPIRVFGRQLAQCRPEDHRLLIAIGVDEHDLAAALRERGLADRHHRGDAAAAGQQQEVVVQLFGNENPGRCQHMHVHAGMGVVADPVGPVAVGGAFDRDGQPIVQMRRAGQRVTARHRSGAVGRNAQREVLAGGVREFIGRPVGNLEDQRPGVGGLFDDLGDSNLQDVLPERNVRHVISSVSRRQRLAELEQVTELTFGPTTPSPLRSR